MSSAEPKTIRYTPEQDRVIDAIVAGKSCIVEALAGCAKTTTLVEAARRLSAKDPRRRLLLAFNVRIKDELKLRLKNDPNWSILTMNGLGHRTLMINSRLFNGGTLSLRADKNQAIVGEFMTDKRVRDLVTNSISGESNERSAMLSNVMDVMKMYGAKVGAVTPDSVADLFDRASENRESDVTLHDKADLNRLASLCNAMLARNLEVARVKGVIDFSDQIYLAVNYCPNPGAPWHTVMVDEMQDLSPSNVKQVLNSVGKQLVAVGDRHQSLYQFRLGTSESIEALKASWTAKHGAMTVLPLSVTFRCPSLVVERQKDIVDVTNFRSAPSNKKGVIKFYGKNSWTFSRFLRRISKLGGTRGVILARTNVELLVALTLALREGITLDEISYGGRTPTIYEIQRARSHLPFRRGKDRSLVSAMAFFMHTHPEYADPKSCRALFEGFADNLDPRTGYHKTPLTLSTVHGFKGLEADGVFLLNPGVRMGATGCARYVAETRTRDLLSGGDLPCHALAHSTVSLRNSVALLCGTSVK